MELKPGINLAKKMRSSGNTISSEPHRYGLDLATLRSWSAERTSQYLSEESSKQEIAVAKVRAFLDAIITIVKLQSWWRMMMDRKKYLAYLYDKRHMKRTFYRAWHQRVVAQKKYLYIVVGKYFDGWREVANEEKRLHLILIQFVNISIQRLKLTPPACMAFFDELKWQQVLSTTDRMKIRRLILETLFRGWTLQCRQQKLSRYKASQVLSRMIRRTKGPMWVKESCLVCFHLWYRYTALKNAYRREMPDPLFKNPYLPQWAIVLKDIHLKRIKKTRTLEKGHILTQKRSWRKWRHLMSIDRTKAVTPLAVALQHFKEVWLTKVLAAWSGVVRDRGRVMRFKDKIFYRWRHHIPVFKKLNRLKREADEWIRLRRLRKSYDVMIQICLVVIDKRSESLRKLRKVFCDRKIMVCAYALMHKDEHVMMIECWRRLKVFWRNRQRWKAFLWNYKIEYHDNKSRAIFDAWKSFVKLSKVEKMVPLPNTGSMDTTETEVEERPLFKSLPHRVFNLMMLALAGRLRLKPDEYEHRLICCAISQNLHNVLRGQKGLSSVTDGVQERLQVALDTNNLQMLREALDQGAQVEPKHIYQVGSIFGDQSLPIFAALLSRAVYFMAERVAKQDIPETVNKITHPLNALLLSAHMHRWHCHLNRNVKSANAKKQNPTIRPPEKRKAVKLTSREVSSLTDSNATATSFGGPNQSIQLWRCAVLLLLDCRAQYLISTCKELPESRTLDEEVAEVMKRKKIARIQQLQQSLVQIVELKLGEENSEEIFGEKIDLPPSLAAAASFSTSLHTCDTDNGKEDADLMQINYQLRKIPPVMKTEIVLTPKVQQQPEVLCEGGALEANEASVTSLHSKSMERNIYDVLQQYLILTGRMISEARALRVPLLERDKQLLISGAMKNTRNEYLALRRQCMTAKELQEEAEKKAKKSKGKDGSDGGKKSPKGKGSKKKKTAKKGKKSKKGGKEEEEGGESAEEDMLGENYRSDGQGDLLIDDDLDTEMFLIAYPAVPDPEPNLDLQVDVSVNLSLSSVELADEKEWEAEYGYLRRMRGYRHFFLETWMPIVKAHHIQSRIEKHMKALTSTDKKKESKLILSVRIVRETKFIPRRLLDFVSRDEHFKRAYETFSDLQAANQAQSTSQFVPKISSKESRVGNTNILEMAKTHRSGGVGLWILDFMLSDFDYRNSSTWATVPLEWWLPTLINEHLKHDQVRTEASLTAVNTTIFDAKDRVNDAEKDASRYQKYLKRLRNDLLAVSLRQRGKARDDKVARAAFSAGVNKVNSKISACSKQVKVLNEAISLSELMVATGNLQEAYNALSSNTASSATTVASAGSANLQITGAMVYRKIESAKEEVVSLGQRMQQLEESKVEHEALLKGYDQRCSQTTLMLKDIGIDKFNSIVDVQQLLKRTNSSLKKYNNEATSVELHSWRKFLVKYRKRLDRFQRNKLLPRKEIWSRELDARRMREFLNRRPGSESNIGSGNNTSRVPSAGGVLSARSRPASGFLPDVPASSTLADRRSGMLSVDVDGFIASTRRSMKAGENFQEFDDYSSARNESMHPDAIADTDLGLESELKDYSSVGESDLISDVEQQQIDAEADLDEIYMSSESVRRRDEEARILQEAEKLAVENEDLRMSIFDEYWALLPTREPDVDDSVEADAEEVVVVQEVVKEHVPEIENRTTRMWKSIGEARLREKKEIIEQFMEDASDSEELSNTKELKLLLNSIRIARAQDSDDESRKQDKNFLGDAQINPAQHMLLQVPMIQYEQLAEEVWKKDAPISMSVSMRPDTANAAKVETISDLIDKNIATANAEAGEDNRSRSASVLSSSVASIKTAVLEANANINKQWKTDPFIVAGKQQVDRFRAGFNHRVAVLFDSGFDDDSVVGSTDNGHGSTSPIRSPSQEIRQIGLPPSNIEAPQSSISLPASGSSILEEGINVLPSKSLSDHHQSLLFSDDLSDASSKASKRHDRQHQQAVDEYLHLIEEKDNVSLSHKSQRSLVSNINAPTPTPSVSGDREALAVFPGVSRENSIAANSQKLLEDEQSRSSSNLSKRQEAAIVEAAPLVAVAVAEVAIGRPPLTPPPTAALSLHPSTPPEFLVFDSMSVMSSVSKAPSLKGDDKEHASPKFLRIADESFQPTSVPSFNGIAAAAGEGETSDSSVPRDQQSERSRTEVDSGDPCIRFIPNDSSDERSLRSSNSRESIRSIHTSLHSANQYMQFMPTDMSTDNIAVCSVVDGKLQWALQPSDPISHGGISRGRAQSPSRTTFDDSMQFTPSVVSLTNLSTKSTLRTIESVVPPEKASAQVRLSSRLGLLSPHFHHNETLHDGDFGSENFLATEESLYDIAQGLTEEHQQEFDKQQKFAKFKDQSSRITFFPSDFFSKQDRSILQLQIQRSIKSANKKALTQEDKDADLRAEIARERELQRQFLEAKVAQLAVDDGKKQELAGLQLIAVNNIVNFVNTVEELQNREPYVPKNYCKEFGHLSRALKDVKKLQNPKRISNPNNNAKASFSPHEIQTLTNSNALLEVDAEDDSSHNSVVSSVPGPSPTISESMKVQKLPHPTNPESDRSYSFRSSSTNQNKLLGKSATEVGLNVPHPLTVSLLQQSSSEGRLSQPKKREKLISRSVERPAPTTAAAVEELLTVVRDQSTLNSYDQAVEQAVKLLFGHDASSSSQHLDTGVESQSSRVPDLDHYPRPLLAKEYEQSVDRSNALASAQILSMMLAHDEAPDPRPPTDVSAKHDKIAVNAFRYSNESKVVGDGMRSPIPNRIIFDGEALSNSIHAAAAVTASSHEKSESQKIQGKDERKAVVQNNLHSDGREKHKDEEIDLSGLLLVGSKSNSRPQLSAAVEVTAPTTRTNKSTTLGRTAPLSLLEYRQQQLLQQQQGENFDGGGVKIDTRLRSAENSLVFGINDERLFQSAFSLPLPIDTNNIHQNLVPGIDSFYANDTEFSRTHTRSRDPGARTPLSPPSVSLTGFDFLRQPSLNGNIQPTFISKLAAQDDGGVRNAVALLSDEDERDMEQELRAYLSSGITTLSTTATVGKTKGKAKIPRKNGKLLPPLCSTLPEVVERQVGKKGQHPDHIEKVYVGLSTVLKSKGAQKLALQQRSDNAAAKSGGRQFVLDPLDAAAAPAFAPNKRVSSGDNKITMPTVGLIRSGVSSGSVASGKNSHLSNIS